MAVVAQKMYWGAVVFGREAPFYCNSFSFAQLWLPIQAGFIYFAKRECSSGPRIPMTLESQLNRKNYLPLLTVLRRQFKSQAQSLSHAHLVEHGFSR